MSWATKPMCAVCKLEPPKTAQAKDAEFICLSQAAGLIGSTSDARSECDKTWAGVPGLPSLGHQSHRIVAKPPDPIFCCGTHAIKLGHRGCVCCTSKD